MKRFLLISLTLLMPVTGVWTFAGKRANLAASDALVPIAMLLLLWWMVQGKGRFPQLGLFCLSTALVALSSLLNIEASLAAKGPVGMWVEFVKLAVLWIYFYLVTNLVETRDDFLLALKTWVVTSAGVALTGIGGAISYQATGAENPFSGMFRAQGTMGDSNLFASFLATSFFVALFYRSLKTPRPNWVLAPMLLHVVGILLSASRGTTLYFCFALFLLFVLVSNMKVRLASAAVLLVAAVVVMAIPNKESILRSNPYTARLLTTTLSLDSANASDRTVLWTSAVERFQRSPLFGIGRGNFRPLDQRDPTQTGQVHNAYLEILCELGLIGFAAYAAFFGRHFLGLLFRSSAAPSRLLLMALTTLFLCGLTISIENFRGVWMLVGLIDCHQRFYAPAA